MRNVVLLCLDTVRKDYFDEFAPRIRERSDIVYSQARAASCWSVPSHASMLTGRLPSEHGVHAHNLDYTPIENETVLSKLDGYNTIGISANGYANSDFGFDGIFDSFMDVTYESLQIKGLSIEDILFTKTPLPNLRDNGTKSCLKELHSAIVSAEDPIFAFVNLMEAHTPHNHIIGYNRDLHSVANSWSWKEIPRERVVRNPQEYDEYLQNYRELYATSIDYLDRHVSAMIDQLQDATAEPITFVITADHGENLGLESEGHMFGHTSSLSEGVLHVPLTIVNPPGNASVNTEGYVSHLQLPKLLAGLAEGRVPEITQHEIQAEVVGHAISFKSNMTYWDRMLRCVYEEGIKTVWDSLGQSIKYKLPDGKSCNEQKTSENLEIPERHTDKFSTDLFKFKQQASITQHENNKELDADITDRLEDLGYLS